MTQTSMGVVYAKRLFDILVSSVLLVFLSPLLILIAGAITLSDRPGGALYCHERVGRGGRPFSCLKFRTMRVNADTFLPGLLAANVAARAEWELTQKLRHDPRVSPIGRVLRMSSLDELPQLWNVLRGDMSLVGPRPVTPGEMLRWYEPLGAAAAYRAVRPGITGLWQVSGRNSASYERRVELDCKYVAALSFRNDLTILLRTVGAVLRSEGAC